MKKLILLPLIILFFVTCKKKAADPPPEPEPEPTPVQPAGTHHGVFSAEKSLFWTNRTPMGHTYLARVFLHTTPKSGTEIYAKGEDHGAVTSSGVQLEYSPSLRYYRNPTTALSYSAQISFQHTSTAMGSINYTSPDSFPQISAALGAEIKDSLHKTQNFIVPLTNASYYTHAECTLYDGNLDHTGVTKTATTVVTGFTFTPTEMSPLKVGHQNWVRVVLKRQNDQTIGGKLFRFENLTTSSFNIYVK